MKLLLPLITAIAYGTPILPNLPYTYKSVDFTNNDCTGIAYHAVVIHSAEPYQLTRGYEPPVGECSNIKERSTLGVENIEDHLMKGEQYLKFEEVHGGKTFDQYIILNKCLKSDKDTEVFTMYQLDGNMLRFIYFKDDECKSLPHVDESFTRELNDNDVVFTA